MRKLSGPSPRAEIGVSFDSSAGTVAALESLLDLGGRTSDGESQPAVPGLQPPLRVFDLSAAKLGAKRGGNAYRSRHSVVETMEENNHRAGNSAIGMLSLLHKSYLLVTTANPHPRLTTPRSPLLFRCRPASDVAAVQFLLRLPADSASPQESGKEYSTWFLSRLRQLRRGSNMLTATTQAIIYRIHRRTIRSASTSNEGKGVPGLPGVNTVGVRNWTSRAAACWVARGKKRRGGGPTFPLALAFSLNENCCCRSGCR